GIGALFALEGGGIIPSAAGGMVAGGGTLAVLHPREMVLPSAISGGLQSMIARGGANDNGGATGGDTHNYAIHVHAIDTRSGAQFLMSHSDAIAASLHRAKRNFNARA
ncbi:MAG TPA: hypothetical protein VNN79_01615, partial [Actinomycetota bacterium]|nr:hypothetical protein [Actinomycetota bacterium]